MVKQRFAAAILLLFAVIIGTAVCAHAEEYAEIHDGDYDVYIQGSEDPDNPLIVKVMDLNCGVRTTVNDPEPTAEMEIAGHVKLVGLTGKEILYNADDAVNLIVLDDDSSLTIENLTITANTRDAIIDNGDYSTINLERGAVLSGSASTSYGGGLRNGATGTVNINGGIIKDCSARFFGGGVHNSGILNLNSGMIINCVCTGYYIDDRFIYGGTGGGISNTGTVNINGGMIIDCDADKSGGGFYNFSANNVYGSININGGVITGCDAAESGGGFYNTTGCTVTIRGGSIYNNTAPESPNIISDSGSMLKLYGGMLTAPTDATSLYPENAFASSGGIAFGRIADSSVGITVTDFDTNESVEIADATHMLMANRNHTLITTIGGHIYQLKYEDGVWVRLGLYQPTEDALYYNAISDRISVFAAEDGDYDYTLIFAAFNEDGSFESYKTQIVPFPHGAGGQTIDLKYINMDTDNYDTIKIMMWKNITGETPVCKAVLKTSDIPYNYVSNTSTAVD